LDIGGVLLSDGWPHTAREAAAVKFKYDFADAEERHKLIFPTYELGRANLAQYLDDVIFHKKRSFTRKQVWKFMSEQSKSLPQMIELVDQLKRRYKLKIVVVSNEARELNAYRIKKFKLDQLADFFISSCFVQISKPDPRIFRLALDMSQVLPNQVVYIDDRSLFIDVAAREGIQGIHHVRYKTTRALLSELGLRIK
jgi:putative hydrolase of the HAD superfamily